jgi:tryptophan-rich sensory protein
MTHSSARRRHRPRRLALVGAAWAGAVTAVAVVGGLATDTSSLWYQQLDRPAWQPPGAVFGPVWTLLYILLAISATLAWRDVRGPRRRVVLGLYAANLVLNLAWTWIFFQAHAPTAAGVEILALLATILALIGLVGRWNGVAVLLLVPYAAWVTFATALTWRIAAAN